MLKSHSQNVNFIKKIKEIKKWQKQNLTGH